MEIEHLLLDKPVKLCKFCKYYLPMNYVLDEDIEIQADLGECVRYPPKVIDNDDLNDRFPVVSEENWCGEFDF